MTVKNKSDLLAQLETDIPDNIKRRISPTKLREAIRDVLDSILPYSSVEIGSIASPITIARVSQTSKYLSTGIILPEESETEWLWYHLNHGEWHAGRVHDIDVVIAAGHTVVAGDATNVDNPFDEFVELFTQGIQSNTLIVSFGVTVDRELMVAASNSEDTTISRLEVRRPGRI